MRTTGGRVATTRSRGQKEEPDPVELTPYELELLLEEVRVAFQGQRIFWEAVRAGAALGSEEVQDQRLTAVEQPPEQSAEFDLLILGAVFLLESPLAVPIVAGVGRVAARLIRRELAAQARVLRSARSQLAEAEKGLDSARKIATSRQLRADRRAAAFARAGGSGWEQRAKNAQDQSEKARDSVTRALLATKGTRMSYALDLEAYRAALPALRIARHPDFAGYSVAALKTGVQAAQQHWGAGALDDGAISQQVTLRARLEHQALATIEKSCKDQAAYERHIRTKVTTTHEAAEIYQDLGSPASVDIAAVIAHSQFLTAALAWRGLLNVDGARYIRAAEADTRRSPVSGRTTNNIAPGSRQSSKLMGDLKDVPKVHVEYLLARFGKAAEAWARNAPGEVTPPNSFGDTPTQHEVDVSHYLSAAKNDPKLRLDLIVLWLDALGALLMV